MSDTHDETNNLEQLTALGQRMANSDEIDDTLPELEEREAPGLLRFLPPLIQEFWTRKAYFTMEKDGSLSMEGFYKNGPMRLEIRENNQLVALDKRGRITKISSFEDLADLNYFWWKNANTKTSYVDPARPWVDNFVERKMVRRKVIFQPLEGNEGGEE